MKAKEHYALYLKEVDKLGEEKATANIVKRLFEDAVELIQIRHCQRGLAIMAVYREICDKWNAICNYNPSFKRDGFMELLVSRMPEEYKAKVREELK